MKKTLLFLLSFVLVFALCSCKGAGNNVSVSEENVVSGSVEGTSASTENVSKEDDGTKSEEPQKDEEVTDDEKGNGDESGTSDDDGYHGDVIKEEDGSWTGSFGYFIEVDEDGMPEAEAVEMFSRGEIVPMREVWVQYNAKTDEYSFCVPLGNEQLWGSCYGWPSGSEPITGAWFDVGAGENLGSSVFYVQIASDYRHLYISYDYAGDTALYAAPVSEGTGMIHVSLMGNY